MISAFDVYLVMQLGSIKSTLTLIWVLGGLISLLLCFPIVYSLEEGDDIPPIISKLFRLALGSFVVSLSIDTLLPTPQTAAAMYLLPTLTSKEVVSELKPEAKELYQLAKDALRDLATGEEPKPEKE